MENWGRKEVGAKVASGGERSLIAMLPCGVAEHPSGSWRHGFSIMEDLDEQSHMNLQMRIPFERSRLIY